MVEPRDPMTESDIDAYVDGQLDAARRIEVEAYLAAHPGAAARVMADLRACDELRLALAEPEPPAKAGTLAAARRIQGAIARGRYLDLLRRAAAVVMLLATGWVAHEAMGPIFMGAVVASTPPPAYVDEAIRAHGTTIVRAAMHSQPESPQYDSVEIRAATAIVMPELPRSWVVTDVQIYPSQFGPSVEMAVEASDLGTLSLFAVRPGNFDVTEPAATHRDEFSAVWFQVGEVAYTLVAGAGVTDLERIASRLADTFN